MILLIAIISSGCKEQDRAKETVRIVGPYTINSSGDLLLCGIKEGDNSQYYIVPLTNRHAEPIVLKFQDSLGAMWKPRAHQNELPVDELVFITSGQPQHIKTIRICGDEVSELTSYQIDQNLIVTTIRNYPNPSGDILALRVSKYVEDSFSGSYLGFTKDDGKTITISNIRSTTYLSWVDNNTFYALHSLGEEEHEWVISKVELDMVNMTWEVNEILKGNEIMLATDGFSGSFVYAQGKSIYHNTQVLARLPEKVGRLFGDDNYLVCIGFSKNDKNQIYILNDKGEILGTKEKSQTSILIGLSATNECIYLTSSDYKKIIRYNFITRQETVVFDVKEVS